MGNERDDTLDRESLATLAFHVRDDGIAVHRTFMYFVPARPPRRAAADAARDDTVTQPLPRCG